MGEYIGAVGGGHLCKNTIEMNKKYHAKDIKIDRQTDIKINIFILLLANSKIHR